MPDKFKKDDFVYFKDQGYAADQEHPIKGTYWESIGVVVNVNDYISVRWLITEGTYHYYSKYQLRHKHRIRMFFRYLFDCVKEVFLDLKNEFLTYKNYRQFKRGDIICLKKSTILISSCDTGTVVRKSYPQIVVKWENDSIGYSYEQTKNIEYYNGVDPNKLFKSYKRNMS